MTSNNNNGGTHVAADDKKQDDSLFSVSTQQTQFPLLINLIQFIINPTNFALYFRLQVCFNIKTKHSQMQTRSLN